MLKRLRIYYLYVALPFIALLVGAAVFIDPISRTITSNPHPQINYTIFAIVLLGGALILRSVHRLMQEAKALSDFSGALRDGGEQEKLQEMAINLDVDIAYVLRMMAASRGRSISHQEQIAIEHELEKASARLNARNALPQFLTGLLVGLGLLGTFVGLLSTLNDISALIGSFADVDMGNANPIDVFRNMIARMKAPMQSMGIAFSASLFGLLGSIILGFMMVAIRRFLGDILSLLGSEVAQHIEFSLAREGFSYSKGAIKKQLTAGRGAPVLGDQLPARALAGGDGGALPAVSAASTSFAEPAADADAVAAEPPVRRATSTAVSGYQDEELRVLLRIEDRLSESARLQTRALAGEIDDFQKQRADMLRTLAEHTEALTGFRGELQRVGRQLGSILGTMEKSHGDVSAQLTELMVRISDDATETRLLMARQLEEQHLLSESIRTVAVLGNG